MKNAKLFVLPFLIIMCLITSIHSYAGDDIESKYERAIDLIKRLRRVEAKKLFDEIIKEAPNHAPSYYQRALIELHFDNTERAVKDLNKVTEINGKFKNDAHFELGQIKFERQDYNGSIENFNHVIKADPNNAKAFYLRGQSNLKKKELSQAIQDIRKALELEPDNIDYLFNKGRVEYVMEHYDIAIEDFTKVIEKDDSYSDAYFQRANSYFHEGIDPNFKHHKKLMQKALADYDMALQLNPDLEAAYFDRGEVKMELRDFVGAIADFKHALTIKPDDLEAHYLKAMCNYHYGFEEIALKELKEILKMDSTFEAAEYQVAVINYEFQDYKDALTIFNKLIEQEDDHKHADSFIYRGLTYYELGRRDEACADFLKGKELGDKEAGHYVSKYCSDYRPGKTSEK